MFSETVVNTLGGTRLSGGQVVAGNKANLTTSGFVAILSLYGRSGFLSVPIVPVLVSYSFHIHDTICG